MAENRVEMRDAFGEALLELGEEHPTMLFLDADLHTSTKATMFRDRFPGRFYQIGIAEQNLFGVAAGLALEGFVPFASTFAAFAARRALDQLAISICYPGLNVKIPGSYAGVPTSRAGASHNCIEDIAVMRSIPNLLVADPGCAVELRGVMAAAMRHEGPVYFRVSRYSSPRLFGDGHRFAWGRGEVLREGSAVTLFSTGIMVHHCLQAAELLANEGLKAQVVHCASIKPIDSDLIADSLRKTGCGVTAENAGIDGGFGSAVCEIAAERAPSPIERVGVRNRFVESGSIGQLFAEHGMTPEHIRDTAKHVIQRKEGKSVHS